MSPRAAVRAQRGSCHRTPNFPPRHARHNNPVNPVNPVKKNILLFTRNALSSHTSVTNRLLWQTLRLASEDERREINKLSVAGRMSPVAGQAPLMVLSVRRCRDYSGRSRLSIGRPPLSGWSEHPRGSHRLPTRARVHARGACRPRGTKRRPMRQARKNRAGTRRARRGGGTRDRCRPGAFQA